MRPERRILAIAGLLFLSWLLSACSDEKDSGPVDVRWDREVCARCAMAISEPHYAAQIRREEQGRSRVYKFDDIGCAVIWLRERAQLDDPGVEIWVNDYRNGHWLDARKAWYVPGKVTPMGYGLGATPEPEAGALDFAGAVRHIDEVEATFHVHRGGGHTPPGSGGGS